MAQWYPDIPSLTLWYSWPFHHETRRPPWLQSSYTPFKGWRWAKRYGAVLSPPIFLAFDHGGKKSFPKTPPGIALCLIGHYYINHMTTPGCKVVWEHKYLSFSVTSVGVRQGKRHLEWLLSRQLAASALLLWSTWEWKWAWLGQK